MSSSKIILSISLTLLLSGASLSVHAGKWKPVTGTDLVALYSDTVLKGSVKGKKWTGQYCANGTGQIVIGGKAQSRNWNANGEDQICVVRSNGSKGCYTYLQNTKKPGSYRATAVGDGLIVKFKLQEQKPDFCGGS